MKITKFRLRNLDNLYMYSVFLKCSLFLYWYISMNLPAIVFPLY